MRKFRLFIAWILCTVLLCACAANSGGPTNGNTNLPDNPSEENSGTKLKLIDIDLTDLDFAFGIDPQQPELKSELDSVLADALANGDISAIAAKYFDPSFAPERFQTRADSLPDARDNCIVIAVNAQVAPFEYTVNDEITGINVEIAKYVADKLGKNLILYNTVFDDVIFSVGNAPVLADACVMAFPSSFYDEFSLSKSISHYSASQVMLVRENETMFDRCSTRNDVEKILNNGLRMRNRKAGFQKGSVGEYYVDGNESFGYNGLNYLRSQSFPTAADAISDLINGSIDFVFIDKTAANALIKKYS